MIRPLQTLGLTTLLATAATLLTPTAHALPPAALYTDPPADPAHPAGMDIVHIPSHGSIMNGVLWTASGPGPHPAAIIYHGFPGNEPNLDIAQTLRRAGWTVLTFHYRGSWGSTGAFSFTSVFQDSQTALDFLKTNAPRYDIDPHRIAIIGHSMGGMAAALIGAHNPDLLGTVLISAANFGQFGNFPGGQKALTGFMAGNMDSLAGTSPAALATEAATHAPEWDFLKTAPGLAHHPVLVITANDGLVKQDDALASAINAITPNDATEIHFPTDHGYSDRRIALQSTILTWLAHLGHR